MLLPNAHRLNLLSSREICRFVPSVTGELSICPKRQAKWLRVATARTRTFDLVQASRVSCISRSHKDVSHLDIPVFTRVYAQPQDDCSLNFG